MGPKAKKKGKEVRPLEVPEVAQADVEAARKLLADKDELKRQRSNMKYWLQSQSMDKSYDILTSDAKMEFLEKHLASKIAKGTIKTSLKTSKSIDVTTTNANNFTWMNKKQMIDMWGPEKTEAKLASGTRHT
eukprot:4626974-Pyramimonas_sp.AAC.1